MYVIFDNLEPAQLTRIYLAWNAMDNDNSLKILVIKIVSYPKFISLNLSNNQLFKDLQQIIKLFANLNLIK